MAPPLVSAAKRAPGEGRRDAIDAVAVEVSHARPTARRDPLGRQLDDGVEVVPGQLAVRSGPAKKVEEPLLLPPPAAETSAITCWARNVQRRGRGQHCVEPAFADRCEKSRALDKSSRVVGKSTPSGTPWREWLERPTRCRKVEIASGSPPGRPARPGRCRCRARGKRSPRAHEARPHAGATRYAGAAQRRGSRGGRLLGRARDLSEQVGEALGQPAGVDEDERRLVALDMGGDALDDVAHLLLRQDSRELLFR